MLMKSYDLIFLGEFCNRIILSRVIRGKGAWKFSVFAEMCEGRVYNFSALWKSRKYRISRDFEVVMYPVGGISGEGSNRMQERIGLFCCFEHIFGKIPMDIYLIHFNQHSEERSDDRKLKAVETINNHIRLHATATMKLLIGDWNCEPFELPLRNLEAWRAVSAQSSFSGWYNPFWKYLHDECGTIVDKKEHRHGTCYPVFDQIVINQRAIQEYHLGISSVIEMDLVSEIDGHHRPIGLCLNRKRGIK